MKNNNENHFPPLTMLPALSYTLVDALDASKEQLANLLQAENNPYVLDNETVDRVIQCYKEQIKKIGYARKLCEHWRQQPFTTEQRNSIDEMTVNLIEMEKLNQRLLFLADHFKEHTIDKILGMKDEDLALAYLTGKLYPSTRSSSSTTTSEPSSQQKRFVIPPGVTCQHRKTSNKKSYIFRHAEWGEIGRIDIVPHGNQSQIITYAVAGDPRDPLTQLRHSLFSTIATAFNQELEKKYGPATPAQLPPVDLKSDKKLIESKAMVCLKCNTPVALLVFAHEAYTSDQLEDYARMMYSNIIEIDLPTWIIGAEKKLVPGKEGIALILKIWPERRKAEKISSIIFEPMLYQLQTSHCKN